MRLCSPARPSPSLPRVRRLHNRRPAIEPVRPVRCLVDRHQLRGGLLIGAVLVLWLIGAIVIHQLGSRRLNYQSTSIVTMSTRTGGLLLPATGGTMLRMELTLDASGPSDSPPDTMVLTLRIPERSHNVPYLRLDAISRTVEVFGSGDPRRSMPYTSVSVDESRRSASPLTWCFALPWQST